GMIRKALTTVLCLAQLVLLDHGAHRTVQDHDALQQKSGELAPTRIGFRGIWQAGKRHGTPANAGGERNAQERERTRYGNKPLRQATTARQVLHWRPNRCRLAAVKRETGPATCAAPATVSVSPRASLARGAAPIATARQGGKAGVAGTLPGRQP